ncbi:hypothetical protein O6H91_03G033300 [Diphasiastrum complanatum]|uniref:Uncharacterized protein n=1 Tax=Diphasiastrum complanatum TaxID=34168 RepID=A0ACC2E5A9_DIPCM|nr:hypothetical protein O6H91_03G033300 [Diphasiastrum complanatum]
MKRSSLVLLSAGVVAGSLLSISLLKLLELSSSSSSKTSSKSSCVTKNLLFPLSGYGGVGFEDEIIEEHLTRNIQFLGLESQLQVHKAFVVVIGLGGVGSHAAAMLLRSGVGKLRVVDFDQVSLSSLNRHAVATRADVGLPKALCLKEHFARIFPECVVDARVQMFDPRSEAELLGDTPDFVLDCIDNIDTKVFLLASCVRRGLKVISATGAGARADPTRIRVADLRESSNDPLSRSVVPGFRVRIIPVLWNHSAIFGQSLLFGTSEAVEVDKEEVAYIVRDLWRGRSARNQDSRDVGRGMWKLDEESDID